MSGPGPRKGKALASIATAIRSEVDGLVDAWTKAGLTEVASPEFAAYITTLSALNHVQQALSPGRYWTLEARRSAPRTVDDSLRLGAGICGNHQQAMLDVMRLIGYEARPIGLYYRGAFGTPASHATVEVAWGGAWHYVDVTNGAVFRRSGAPGWDLLSITDLLQTDDPQALAIANGSKAELQLTREFVGDPLDYLSSNPDVVIDGQGTVRVNGVANGKGVDFSLEGVPNYVGVTLGSTGGLKALRLGLRMEAPISELDIAITSVAASELQLRLEASDEGWEQVVHPGDLATSIPVRKSAGELRLSASPPDGEIGYLIIAHLRGRAAQDAV